MALKPNNEPKRSSSVDTLSSRLARENVLNEANFATAQSGSSVAAQAHRSSRLRLWHYLLVGGVVLCLLLLGFWLYKTLSKKSSTGVEGISKYNTTTLDVGGLNAATGQGTSTNQLVVNGAIQINGSAVATTFKGNGSDLTNLNANNITLGSLSDARLSANVALLSRTQTFRGTNTFNGATNFGSSVAFAGIQYSFPTSQEGGFLKNDGNGNLTWTSSGFGGGGGGCVAQCVNNGGDSFGSAISIGSNDSFGMALRTSGADRLTISPTGAAVFSSNVTAPFFLGDGSSISNINASNITTGTLSNARLSGSVTVQGNTFNGLDQLVQLNSLGYLPSLNGGNLTSLNASFVTSGTLSDARLSGNVPLLDGNQTFGGNNTFSNTITVNTLTPNAAMTIGATNQNLTLQGTGSTTWTSTQGGGTATVGFSGVAAANVRYNFNSAVSAGTYEICTTSGNCVNAGGGVSSAGGTLNTLAKFSGPLAVADSTISDTGTVVTIGAATTNITSSQVHINGASGAYPLDVTGDINLSQNLRIGGNIICDSSGCATGGSSSAINNTTSVQTNANFFIQSAGVNNPTGIIKALAGQNADLLQFQNSSGSTIAEFYNNAGLNTTGGYYVSGAALNSTHLSDTANIARLNANQTFSGQNIFGNTTTVTGQFISQMGTNNVNALKVINSGNTMTVLAADTINNRVGVNNAAPSYALDVTGDINSSTGLRVGGNLVCDSTGCASSGSSGYYIQNGVATQTSANFNIKTVDANNVVGVLQGAASQAVDLFQIKDSTSANVFKVGNTGLTTINNGITFTGGNQVVQNGTGSLSLVSNSTTLALNNTAVFTSGDGAGLRYAANYSYQPLSLVTRQYVDDSISGVVAGSCPTCFITGGNSFGTSAAIGTNDNNTLTIETANTSRIFLGTNGGIAMQGSTASGNYATGAGGGLASGDYSFAINSGTASGQHSFAGGYAVNAITAAGNGSMAFGYSANGAITANGIGSFAGGNNSSTSATAAYSLAFGYSASTGTNATAAAAFNSGQATGAYSFAVGVGTASGNESFAGGYADIYNITASNNGSFAFGRAQGANAITASGQGSFAIGYSQNGAITAQGIGSLAGGDNSITGSGARFSIAYGTGTQATGDYSAAFNNSVSSNSGSFAINSATASGIYSFAGGEVSTQAYARRSFAFGYNVKSNNSTGEGAIAFGRDTVANGNYGFAAGYGARTSGGDANVAFNYALASGSGAFAMGSTLVESSGTYSFAGGYANQAITSSSNGSFAYGRAQNYAITASGEGSMAIGHAVNGAITAAGNGSFAGGNGSSTGAGGHYSIAFGHSTQANGQYSAAFNNSIASGTGAFSTGNAVASGTLAFATGYNTGAGAITASGDGAFAGGRTASNLSITASGYGSIAFGYTGTGNITTNNAAGAFAGGDNSSVGNGANYSIAFGTGTQANGVYSAAFNNSTAAGTGAFAINSATATGIYSFAGGESGTQAYARRSFAFGTNVKANDVNGEGAVAFGRDTVANHNYSFAAGYGARTSAEAAAAFNYAQASGSGAFAMGSTLVNSSGAYSFAGGYASSAISSSSNGSFAFGRTGSNALTASGEGSVAFGYANYAITSSGVGALAIGYSGNGAITAAGNASFAGGDGSTTCASCHGGIAYGYFATLTAGTAGAAFNNATTSHDYAFAANNGTASGQYSAAFGTLTTASGFNSTAFGRKMTVSNNYSFGVSLADANYTLAEANTASFMGGYVGINTTTPGSSFNSALVVAGSGYSYGSVVTSSGVATMVRAGDNSSGTLATFQRADGTTVGSITHNGSNTAFNTSSDERLKHDISDTAFNLETVLNLKIHDYKYNNDASGTTYTGFIAQELEKLYPGAVSVMDPATGYLGVDYGKLTPLLAKGIQDLNTKVDNIQSQVNGLKNSPNGTTVDVLAELAKANAITLNGDLVVNGKVIIAGTLELKGDNKGTATLPAGQTKLHITFKKGFSETPSVTATPKNLTKASFAIQNETATGFDIVIDSAQSEDLQFNYQAF